MALAERSLEAYERVLASSTALSRPHVAFAQGVCLVLLGRVDEAQRMFDAALAGPAKARAWHAKGRLFNKQGDGAGAAYCLDRAAGAVAEAVTACRLKAAPKASKGEDAKADAQADAKALHELEAHAAEIAADLAVLRSDGDDGDGDDGGGSSGADETLDSGSVGLFGRTATAPPQALSPLSGAKHFSSRELRAAAWEEPAPNPLSPPAPLAAAALAALTQAAVTACRHNLERALTSSPPGSPLYEPSSSSSSAGSPSSPPSSGSKGSPTSRRASSVVLGERKGSPTLAARSSPMAEVPLNLSVAVDEWKEDRDERLGIDRIVDEPANGYENEALASFLGGGLGNGVKTGALNKAWSTRSAGLYQRGNSARAPTEDAEAWEAASSRAGHADSAAVAEAAKAAKQAAKQAEVMAADSDVFTSPARRSQRTGAQWLPPFTVEICAATMVEAVASRGEVTPAAARGVRFLDGDDCDDGGGEGSRRPARRWDPLSSPLPTPARRRMFDGVANYEVVATVVDEVRGVRPLRDQAPLSPSSDAVNVTSPTPDLMLGGASSRGSPGGTSYVALGSSTLRLLALETTTHLDHAFQTMTTKQAASSVTASADADADGDGAENDGNYGGSGGAPQRSAYSGKGRDGGRGGGVATTTATVEWGAGGMLTIVGGRSTSVLVLTLLKHSAGRRDPVNPNAVSWAREAVGQFGLPLTSLASALRMVQGRIVLTGTAPLEPPSVWLRHGGPTENGNGSSSGGGFGSPASSSGTNLFPSPGNGAAAAAAAAAAVSASVTFKVHANSRLDTLAASRALGTPFAVGGKATALPTPGGNAVPALPCALALVNDGDEAVVRATGVEDT